MKKFFQLVTLLCAASLVWGQQPSPPSPPIFTQQLNLPVSTNLPPVTSVNASVVGNPGPQTIFYWVVTNYTLGATSVSGPFRVEHAANVLSGSNYVAVTPNYPPSAASVDLLKTANAVPPTGACNCAVATGVASGTINDQSNSTNSYTVSPLNLNAFNITLDNEVVGAGATHPILRQGSTSVDLFNITPGGTPGLNTQVIYNNAGTLAGSAGLTFNNGTNSLTALGGITGNGFTLTGVGGGFNLVGVGGTLPTVSAGSGGVGVAAGGIVQININGAGWLASAAITGTPTNNNCAKFSVASGVATITDAGAVCGSGSSTVFQANGTPLTSSTTVNFQNSAAFNGLTATFSNPSLGNVQLGFSGTLGNGGLTNSAITFNGTANQITSPGSTSLGGTATFALTSPLIPPGDVQLNTANNLNWLLSGTPNLNLSSDSTTGILDIGTGGGQGDTTGSAKAASFIANGAGAGAFTAKPGNGTCPAATALFFIVCNNGGTGFFQVSENGGGYGPLAISSLGAANRANPINNGDNAQVWNWSLTTAGKFGFTFGENVASTATGTPALVDIQTLATSTAHPFQVTAGGTTNGWRVSSSNVLIPLGTGTFDMHASTSTPSVQLPNAIGGTILAGTSTANLSTPFVIQNTNSTNNNTSVAAIISSPGTSTGQIGLIVNGAATGGDLTDWVTGGSVASGVISGQTKVASVNVGGAFVSGGSTAGFIDFPQGSTSAAVAPCNVANSICEQAPAAVTSYLVNKPGTGAAGLLAGTGTSTRTENYTGSSAFHVGPITIGSGSSIAATSLCSTTNCPAGDYDVSVYIEITTACTTTGSYIVWLGYTDDAGAKTGSSTTTYFAAAGGLGVTPATASAGATLVPVSTTDFMTGHYFLHTTGAATSALGSINYGSTATACGTGGPMVGKMFLTVVPLS